MQRGLEDASLHGFRVSCQRPTSRALHFSSRSSLRISIFDSSLRLPMAKKSAFRPSPSWQPSAESRCTVQHATCDRFRLFTAYLQMLHAVKYLCPKYELTIGYCTLQESKAPSRTASPGNSAAGRRLSLGRGSRPRHSDSDP